MATTAPRQYSWLAHQPIQRKILLAIGSLTLLFVISGSVTLLSLSRQDESWQWSRHTYEVRQALDDIIEGLQDSQAAVRGYLLTQSAKELAAFQNGNRRWQVGIDTVRKLTADNPLQQTRLDRVQAMTTQWEQEAQRNGIEAVNAIKVSGDAEVALLRSRAQATYMEHRTVTGNDVVGLINQMDATEAALLSQREIAQRRDEVIVRAVTWAGMLITVLFGLAVVRLTYRLITRPIRRMTDLMTRLAQHDHTVEIRQTERRDEIGEIARALLVFKQMAIETAAQTWVKGNVSDISGELQKVSDQREFGDRLTGTLVPLLEAGVGVFYGFDEEHGSLELQGSYGYRERRHLSTRYALGEGLVGQCALERKPITLQDVPADYVRIHSATGEASPSSISVLPLLSRDKLMGVLELASFKHLSYAQENLLDELLPIAALSLENLGRALRTKDLLNRTREQADELRASEETLRNQQHELQASNEELSLKTHELQEQSQRLLASEEELRVQTEELQASNEELRQKSETLNQQKHMLEALQHETQEKADELARASQYKSEFLANMSHELRTPLNSLLILSRSLAENREGNLDGEQVESARIIHDSGSNLLRLINDILDLSKVEAGKMELVLAELPLADLERTLKRTFNHVAQEKGLEFRVEIEAGVPAGIFTDAAKLEQVANNLVGNAFKFTHQGGVTVRIARPPSGLALPASLQGKPAIAIAVHDTGIGIPRAKAERVFNAFEQVDASTSRQYGGTGLGLAISRRLVELLGGDIVLDSEEGRGSIFTMLLPERADGTAAPAPTPGAAAEPRPAPVSALLPESIEDDRDTLAEGDTAILIVEDDPVFARILADMVRRKGYRALAAADGESGLQLAQRFRPTGILLDVMLPGMDGWTVIARLKENAVTRHIPVHFISAVDDASRGRELGAVGFLTKPVSRESIDGAFERMLHFAEGQARRLLIVDDDADSRAAMRTLLRGDDVTIDEAASGEEALQRTGEAEYDCIVLDLGLPGMSGMEFLERMGNGGKVPPVVIYSGRELSREESLKLRQYTDSIVIKGARSPERLMDEVSLFLHSIRGGHARAAAPAAAPAHAPAVNGMPSELSGRKVLLVDDDMRNLFALSKVLRGWGMQVNMAQDGQKALKALDEQSGVEVVLMDIMMPVMDGYDTIREIRAQQRFAKLPIIALTAKAMRGDREKCLEAGANDYLSKPIDIDKLSSMLRVWLHR
ncbi:response regulator [Dyella sp. LX-66]|uniref:response regulator n=1 Tax=unclassified Dyella TaxID=2634549 RepID=UPI001BDFFEEF|nr:MULTISPECIES: response regulator [unclassified Dyella]MBT2116231.1 response regulator [Dyella sp. LX-1]MBT2138241.1 response regulator [Dyella sp. LX-66]